MKWKNRVLLKITSLILLLSLSAISAQAENAAASATSAGHLLVFFWSPGQTTFGKGDVVDVTAVTGQEVSGPVVQWGRTGQERIAGVSPFGDLLVFSWSTKGWYFINVSAHVSEPSCKASRKLKPPSGLPLLGPRCIVRI